jgi:hypothetical protein
VSFCYLKSTWQLRIVKFYAGSKKLWFYWWRGEIPAIMENLPASIIWFDLSSDLFIAKRHRSSFIMRNNETYVLEVMAGSDPLLVATKPTPVTTLLAAQSMTISNTKFGINCSGISVDAVHNQPSYPIDVECGDKRGLKTSNGHWICNSISDQFNH